MADKNIKKRLARLKRKRRIRRKVFGTPEKPRLAVFKSAKHIYAQLVDDRNGKTITGVSTLSKELQDSIKEIHKKEGKVGVSKLIGKTIAERAKKLNIESVVFDRNGFIFHGRVKAVAEGAREGGLKF
ncbi:50S ribosomal protein L18 [bacterium BMS3Bbin03]|nr:50S ribosomal protein L18 [bacterium BMS3Bbin03]HDL78985.1 50S ribosomal protein L18 [Bacteroidota bacterium]